MIERLATGVDVIDRRLGGGVSPGSVVALTAPPETGSEYLFQALLDSHGGRYLSMLRAADELEGDFADDVEVSHVRPNGLLEAPEVAVSGIPERSVVVVDPVNELETGEDADSYVTFLATLKRQLAETQSVGLLHCFTSDPAPTYRWLTLGRADLAWHIELTRLPLSVETRLYITKSRSGMTLAEPLKVRFNQGVSVDTSRDI